MPPVHFTVSQIRSAAACPRIVYFDATDARMRDLRQVSVTRIWKAGRTESTACGTLFHAAIDRFNRQAVADPAVRELLSSAADRDALGQGLLTLVYRECVDREALFTRPADRQQAFIAALRCYLGELADIVLHTRASGKLTDEMLDELFGDRRRRVDVTFAVGPTGEPVHVTGVLDYVFYDWRTGRNRIIDYKLTPADKPANDLFQVCVYALMHHVQHGTEPGVGVLYLHPTRQMIEKPWEQVYAERHVVYNLLASMRDWVAYDEAASQGLKAPGEPIYCDVCRWNDQCVQRLGPKHEGRRLTNWNIPDPATGQAISRSKDAASASATETDAKATVPAAPATRPAADMPAADALLLGSTVHQTAPVVLPLSVLPTHVAVVGAAGSGKTWLAKLVAEEAALQGVPVIAVDSQGDLVQFLRRRDRPDLPVDLYSRYDRFWQLARPRVFTPGSSHGIRLCLSPLRLPSPEELDSFSDPVRKAEELEGLLSSVAGNMVTLAKAGGDADCQRTFLLQVLRLLTSGGSRAVGLADVAAAASQPESIGIDSPERFVKKGEREKLARKLNGLLHGTSASLFSGGQPLDLDTLLRPERSDAVPLNVIYLNALTDDDQKQFFVAALAAEIYRWMVTAGSRGSRPQMLFYLDEARDYVPAGSRKPPAKEPLLRLFAQGRKYGVACLLCTQSPRSVDYQAFGNCSTKLIGRLESSQDTERVAEWFSSEGPAPSWLHGRKGAEPGTFVARWPGMPSELEGQPWKSRVLFSAHEGAWPPERVELECSASRD
jgi:CRISPR/Cas system-associated exonuclease Cas4 (RecB family)